MKNTVKRLVKSFIGTLISITGKTRAGQYLYNQILNTAMGQALEISHGPLDLTLAAPNQVCRFRVETFSTKEPETLEWIDGIPEGAVLWDIGANIGLYSIYAAKQRNCRVWAFEPSVFNLELLARNVFLNGVNDRICLVPLALSDRLGPSQMRMTSTEWGGALSTFGQDYGWDGKKIHQVFEFQTLGFSMEDAAQRLGVPKPDYIKMDVDGIEHLILQGGKAVMSEVKGILVEVNDDFREQGEQCQRLLSEAGLVLVEKRHSDMFNSASSFGGGRVWNQIWIRSLASHDIA